MDDLTELDLIMLIHKPMKGLRMEVFPRFHFFLCNDTDALIVRERYIEKIKIKIFFLCNAHVQSIHPCAIT